MSHGERCGAQVDYGETLVGDEKDIVTRIEGQCRDDILKLFGQRESNSEPAGGHVGYLKIVYIGREEEASRVIELGV